MTPSAGASRPAIAAWEKCGCAWIPNSQNVPSSISSAIRSRAVNLRASCCLAMRSSPPPSLARSRRSARSSTSGRSRLAGCSVVDMRLLQKRFQGPGGSLDVLGFDVDLHPHALRLVGNRLEQVVELVGANRIENVAVEVVINRRAVDRVLHGDQRVEPGADDRRAAALDVLALRSLQLNHARKHEALGGERLRDA